MLTHGIAATCCYAVVGERGNMSGHPRDDVRQQRIENEIIVDAYGPEEQALGWYYYLESNLQFAFRAKCIAERAISALRVGEAVEVVGMAPEEDCLHDMFVMVKWKDRTFGVPLSQLEGVAIDQETQQAIEDWKYWVEQGYEL